MNEELSPLSRREFVTLGGAAAASLVAPSVASSASATAPSSSTRIDGYEQEQYKRRALRAMTMIHDGEYDAAIDHLHRQLEAIPGDPEFFYALAVAHGQNGDLDTAVDYARQAVNAGLPPSRFLAGPRELLAPLATTHAFRTLVYRRHEADYVHGPLLGAVTDTQAQVWVRTPSTASLQVVMQPDGGKAVHRSAMVQTQADRDFTAVARVEGLQPDTAYTYRLHIDGREQPDQWTFRTFPAAGEAASFEIGFGACAGYTPWRERIWQRIASHNFPAFMLLGDNVYIDRPERPALQRYCYYRRQSRPEFRALTATTSIAAIWDDHDFGDNDSEGGPDRFTPAWKVDAWKVFRNNWSNMAYGGGEEQPGVWHRWSIADVDVFMLDGRYYRTDVNIDAPSMLGPVQKQWLFDALRASTATFKLIASPVPFPDGAKPGEWDWRSDTWEGYPDERAEIFSFIADHRINGVVLLTGDRHRADVWKIERTDSYDLYEFQNARLTNIHTHDSVPGALFSYNDTCHFGRLRIDTTKADPTITYDIISIDGEVVHSVTLRRSQLTAA
jgi:alkaline phosphatase D